MEEAKSSEHVPPAHLERSLEHILFASRWMLAPLYAGLGVVLLLVVFTFFEELWHAISDLRSATEAKLVVSALSLVDVVLLANLVLMVMLSGYENVVSRLDVATGDRPSWLRKLDTSGLKLKLFGSLIAISGIQVLRQFMDLQQAVDPAALESRRSVLVYMLATHLTFVVTGVLIALSDRLAHGGRSAGSGSGAH
jgi:uncharacterized protein (TIGR00645 family)